MAMLVGRITRDAVVNLLKDERQVVNFYLVLNDYYKPKGSGRGVKTTTYVSYSYWIASKIAERLKKCSLVEVNGRLYVTVYNSTGGDAKGTLHCHVNSIKIHSLEKDISNETVKTISVGETSSDLPF